MGPAEHFPEKISRITTLTVDGLGEGLASLASETVILLMVVWRYTSLAGPVMSRICGGDRRRISREKVGVDVVEIVIDTGSQCVVGVSRN